jgi:peptide/nickel transport system substrate-binding protein/microcin C transport system substrate-binding protein
MKTTAALFVIFAAHIAWGAPSAAPKSHGNPSAPQGGTFAINISAEPETLNPITSTDGYASQVQAYIMDSLMGIDPETYEPVPGLAEKSEISKDGKTFTFTLRKGLTFDDGKPLTTEDVKFSFDAIFDPKYNAAHMRPYYENIEKAEIVSPEVIKFTAKTKYFDNFKVVATMTIVPKHVYGDAAVGSKLNKTITGSGPYKLEKYDKGQSIVLVKNKSWWGYSDPSMKGRWNFERIRIRFLKDSNIAIEALKKGDIDEHPLTPEEYVKKTTGPEFGKTVIKVKTQNQAPKQWSYIGWNLRRPLFADKNVRLALYKLINRDEMIQKFRYGMALPVPGPWYPQSVYADPNVKPVKFDPKAAVELLKKEGWTDSDKDGYLDKVVDGKKTNLSFTLTYANKDSEKYWVMYQSDLRKVGIDMKLQLLDWNALLKNLDESKFDAIAMSWGGGSVDMDPKQIWHSSSAVKGGSNFIGYKNAEVDKLIDEGRAELDKKKRIGIYRKIYAKIAADVPYAFLWCDRDALYARSSRIGVVKDTYTYAIGEEYWWMAK